MSKSLKVYRDHTRLIISTYRDTTNRSNSGASTRGEITGFSPKAGKRMSDYLASAAATYRYMGTLTVREWSLEGKKFKAAMELYFNWKLEKMRAVCDQWGVPPSEASIFWFLEFQARGAPHLHYFYTHPFNWFDCATKWASVVRQPDIVRQCSKFEKLNLGRSGAISYAKKYAAKQYQKEVPENYRNVGRFWGIRGMRLTLAAASIVRSSEGVRLIESDVWERVKELEQQNKVRVFRWKERAGVTIVSKEGFDHSRNGLMEMVDTIMVGDINSRADSRMRDRAAKRSEEIENGLRWQRWRAREGQSLFRKA